MPISDTSPEAAAIQLRIWRGMTGEQRIKLALDMSSLARQFTKAGIRRDHPEWPEAEIMAEYIRRISLLQPVGLRL